MEINFLLSIAPIFNKYLLIFQIDGSLVHCLYEEMKVLLFTVMRRFLKPETVNDCKVTKDRL